MTVNFIVTVMEFILYHSFKHLTILVPSGTRFEKGDFSSFFKGRYNFEGFWENQLSKHLFHNFILNNNVFFVYFVFLQIY